MLKAKIAIAAIALLVAPVLAFADGDSGGSRSVAQFMRMRAPSVAARIGNDRWSNGVSFNMDDQKSFSLGLGVDFNAFAIDFDMEAFTDRDKRTRSDLVSLTFSFPVAVPDLVDMSAGLGLAVWGNAGMQRVQNALHTLMGIGTLDLDYPGHPRISARIFADADIYCVLGGFRLSAYASADCRTSLYAQEELRGKVSVEGLSVFAGWKFMQSFLDSATLNDWIALERGLQAGYEIRKGAFFADYHVNPLTRQGYGNVEISILKPYRKTKISYRFAKVWRCFLAGGKPDGFTNFNVVGAQYAGFFLQTHFNTGIDGAPMDNGIFSFGYALSLIPSLEIRACAECARFSTNPEHASEYCFGAGAELECMMDIGEVCCVSAIAGIEFLTRGWSSMYLGMGVRLL